MQVKDQQFLIDPSDPRWMDFINSSSEANIFHHPAWMELMSECYGYSPVILVVPDENGEIRAGLPFMKVNSLLTGQRWVSLPFSDYCNPLYRDDSALAALTQQLVLIHQENRLEKLEVRWELPECADIQKVSEFVLHTIKFNTRSGTDC